MGNYSNKKEEYIEEYSKSPRKSYFTLNEIKQYEEEIKDMTYLDKKELFKKKINSLEFSIDKYKDYIEILKLLILDNTNKEILEKYIIFLKENNELFKKDNLKDMPNYENEIECYKICFSVEECEKYFGKGIKNKSEKENLKNFLKFIISKKDDELYDELNKMKLKISKFNQPINFENKELFYYKNYVLILYLFSPIEKNKKYNVLVKTRKEIIKYILDNNLLDNEDINKDEESFNYFIISLINSYDCDTFTKNILKLKMYSTKEYEEIIYKNKNIFLEYDKEKKEVSISSSYLTFSDNKNLKSIINTEQITYDIILSHNFIDLEDVYNFNYAKNNNFFFKNKEILNNFLLKVFNSKVFEDIHNELYNNEYYKSKKNIFKNKKVIEDVLNKHIFFYPFDIEDSGCTDKLSLNIFFPIYKYQNTNVKSAQIKQNFKYYFEVLKLGRCIDILYHEINHCIQIIYHFNNNGFSSIYTPIRKNLGKKREGGNYIEMLLFGRTIEKLTLSEAMYILNQKNYDKTLEQFKEGFIKVKNLENMDDLEANGVFKDIISKITIKESKYGYYNDLKSLVIEKTFSDEPIFIQITKSDRCTLGGF